MKWNLATDTELIAVIYDPMASAFDVASAAEEWERRHPGKSVYSIMQYKIRRR